MSLVGNYIKKINNKSTKNVLMVVTALAASLGVSQLYATPAHAGWGSILDKFSDIDPTKPGSSTSPEINFKICNETRDAVTFKLNGVPAFIRSGYCNSYSKYPQGTDVGFKGGFWDLSHGTDYMFSYQNKFGAVGFFRK